MENTALNRKFHPLQSTNVSATTKLLMTDKDFCSELMHVRILQHTGTHPAIIHHCWNLTAEYKLLQLQLCPLCCQMCGTNLYTYVI
jgi:hypothetical protein